LKKYQPFAYEIEATEVVALK